MSKKLEELSIGDTIYYVNNENKISEFIEENVEILMLEENNENKNMLKIISSNNNKSKRITIIVNAIDKKEDVYISFGTHYYTTSYDKAKQKHLENLEANKQKIIDEINKFVK